MKFIIFILTKILPNEKMVGENGRWLKSKTSFRNKYLRLVVLLSKKKKKNHHSTSLAKLDITHLFNFCHYDGQIVASNCGSILHFPDYYWDYAYFHIFFGHLGYALVICLFNPLAHFSIGLFVFFLLMMRYI